MSCGLVICSACRRELEQTGPRSVENGWRHLDGSPRCLAATTDYPQCEAQMSDGSRCTENAVKSVPGGAPFSFLWICGRGHGVDPAADAPAEPVMFRSSVGRRGGAGNERNSPCPCGSGRKYKRCCSGKGSL